MDSHKTIIKICGWGDIACLGVRNTSSIGAWPNSLDRRPPWYCSVSPYSISSVTKNKTKNKISIHKYSWLWLTRHLKVLRSVSSTPTHFEWKRDWQRVHSKSGKPEAPGQCGVQGSAGISVSVSSVISSTSDCCLLSSSFSSVSSSEI